MEGREREGVVLWYSVLTYLTTSQAKQPPLSPFLLPLAWHDSGAREDGRDRHAAENVVYFYDNAHVDVGRKREGELFALSIRRMEKLWRERQLGRHFQWIPSRSLSAHPVEGRSGDAQLEGGGGDGRRGWNYGKCVFPPCTALPSILPSCSLSIPRLRFSPHICAWKRHN